MAVNEKYNAIREKVHQDSKNYELKPRHGLFSQPFSTALGDNGKYQPVKPRKDENGEVMINQPQVLVPGFKKGKAEDAYFQRATYIATGDPFKQVAHASMARTTVKDGHIKAGHDVAFRPAKQVVHLKRGPQAAYEYIPLGPVAKKKMTDETGREVIIQPPNINTAPMKKGTTGGKQTSLFEKPIKYIEDDYDNKKKIAKKEREYHDSKVQDTAWRVGAGDQSLSKFHKGTFNTLRGVYEENPQLPKKNIKEFQPSIAEHDKPFCPSKQVTHKKQDMQAAFPYMENPPTQLKRKIVEESTDVPPNFKQGFKGHSRPTPSVATNFRNLKSQFPSAFRK